MSEVTAETTGAPPDVTTAGEGQGAVIPKSARLGNDAWWKALEEARRFVGRLERLRETDRGKIAALRRNAGQTLGTARGVEWIQGWLEGEPRANDEQFFIVATLFDLNRERSGAEDFGAAMRRVSEQSSDSFERRFLTLLSAEYEPVEGAFDGSRRGGGELAYRLRSMTRLAASKKVGINWPVLLADLCCWEMPGKPVQKKWARHYYAPNLDENTTDTTELNTGENTDVN